MQAVRASHASGQAQGGRDLRSHGWPVLAPASVESIRVDRSFTLYANCNVEYTGRAKSLLDEGRFLIIHKSDGTLLVHADSLCTPRNYQPPGAILRRDGHTLVSTRKGEVILIRISEVLDYTELDQWATHKVDITQTEEELKFAIRDSLLRSPEHYKEVHIEFAIPVGAVDVLAVDHDGTYHVLEVKRKTISVPTVYQLQRYMDYFSEVSIKAIGYTAGPGISKNALVLMAKKGFHHITVQHHQ